MPDDEPNNMLVTRGRVLVVEDEEEINDELVWVLVEAGFAVASVRDGALALELIGRYVFDVLVLDLVMPRIGGLAVIEEVRRRALPLGVVLVSEHIGALDRHRFGEFGISHLLRKPVDPQALVAAVSQLAPGGRSAPRRRPSGRRAAGAPC